MEFCFSSSVTTADEGFSGRDAQKRPAFMRMISNAKAKPKPFDVILVHKFDRFARNREDSIIYKSLLRKECKIKVISITEQMEDNKFSVILESLLEGMAEFYSLNLGEEVKKGMTEKARRGELQTPAPFGYRMIGGVMTPHEDEAEIVRDIFRKYVHEDINLLQIARDVNERGFRTKKGNALDKRLLEYMICNPVYTGKIRWTPTGSVVCRHDFDNPDTMIVDGKHTAIVDQELWEAANRKIRRKSWSGQARRLDGEVTTHWLRGILRCSSCGTTLSFGKGSGNKNASYRCNKYLNGACTASQRITVPKIERAVLEVLLEDSRAFPTEDSVNFSVKNEELPKDIKSIYDILTSLDHSLTKKNNALKEIVLKVVYSKELDLLEFYYYYTE